MFQMYTEGYYQAGAEAARRRGKQAYYDVRNRQKATNFAAAAQLLGIGKTLWDTYSSNKELIDFAEGKGLKTSTSWFTNIFGTPEFTNQAGDVIKRGTVLGIQAIDEWNKNKNLLDTWKGIE